MNDKEAFRAWADKIEVEWGIDGHKVTLFSRLDMEEAWQAACEYKQEEIDAYKDEINQKLQAENAKLRYCVEFYADTVSWDAVECSDTSIVSGVILESDCYETWEKTEISVGGKRARQVLKELEGK